MSLKYRLVHVIGWWRHQMITCSSLLALCVGKSPHKGQWRGALMFSLTCAWTKGWVNNRDAGDLRRHRTQYDVTAMSSIAKMTANNPSYAAVLTIVKSRQFIVYRVYDSVYLPCYLNTCYCCVCNMLLYDDVIKWKHVHRCWPFVRGIHWSAVNSPHKGQWRGTLMFSLMCAWTKGWVNNRDAGDLTHHCTHYDVTAMSLAFDSSHFKL